MSLRIRVTIGSQDVLYKKRVFVTPQVLDLTIDTQIQHKCFKKFGDTKI